MEKINFLFPYNTQTISTNRDDERRPINALLAADPSPMPLKIYGNTKSDRTHPVTDVLLHLDDCCNAPAASAAARASLSTIMPTTLGYTCCWSARTKRQFDWRMRYQTDR